MSASAASQLAPRLPAAFPAIPPEDVRPWLRVRGTLQRRVRKPRGLIDVATFVLVLMVGLYAAWWIGPRIEVPLSAVVEASEDLGFIRPGTAPRHLVGYDISATETPVEAASR